ncbi:hypothetical protein [Oenococcus oeni]
MNPDGIRPWLMLIATGIGLLGSIYAIFRKTLNKFFTDNFKESTESLNETVHLLNESVKKQSEMLDRDFKKIQEIDEKESDHEKRIHTLEDWKEFTNGK